MARLSRLLGVDVIWQLADAKNKLSDLVARALSEGPQIITRRGREVVVVLSLQEYQSLKGDRPSFKSYLRQAPFPEELELERDQSPARDTEL